MGILDKIKQLLNPAAASKPDTPSVAEPSNPPANPGVQGAAEAPTPQAEVPSAPTPAAPPAAAPGAEMPTPPSPATETPVSAASEPDVKG